MKKLLVYGGIILIIVFGVYQKIFIPKHTFKTIKAQQGSMKIVVSGIGNVGAKNIYKIGSIYAGKILDLTVNEGEFIKKGTLIATIDFVDLKDKIDELKATREKVFSDIQSLKIDKQSAIASYNYQIEIYKKNEKLFNKGAISGLEYTKYQTNKEIAKLKIDSISAKISSLEKQSQQLMANINGLKQRLSRYKIYAPVSGYITKKLVSNYQIIMPNQTLIEIINPDDVWIKTYIDTRISGKVKLNSKANIVLQSSNIKYSGFVAHIKPITNSITYEREVDVKFNNLPIPFYLDEQARIKIYVGNLKNIIKIPNKAISFYNGKTGVWILKDKKHVEFKAIKILDNNEKFIATLDISKDTTIVLPNPKNKALVNGMKIYIQGK